MNPTPRVAIVVGSTRPGRMSLDVAQWAHKVISDGSRLCYEIVDLANFELPWLDEPVPAALGQYRNEHTRHWSKTVSGFDAFIFVYPQYNWGYTAVLKNALDYLYREWHGKPASLMTWSYSGGKRGADQLYQVLQGLHMQPLRVRVEAVVGDADKNAALQLIDPEATFGPVRGQLRLIDNNFAQLLMTSEGE